MPDELPQPSVGEAVRLVETVMRHCAQMAEETILMGAVLNAERLNLARALATLKEELDE
jgi:hypothetical protein